MKRGRRDEIEGLFHWTLRTADKRWRRADLIREVQFVAGITSSSMVAEEIYNRMLENGEIVEVRESKHVYVSLSSGALNAWARSESTNLTLQ